MKDHELAPSSRPSSKSRTSLVVQLLEDLADDLSDRLEGLHIVLCLVVVARKGANVEADYKQSTQLLGEMGPTYSA
jgi:hypothetical protein